MHPIRALKQGARWVHEWSLHWANTRWGGLALFICALADSSLFPMPTAVFTLTLMVMRIERAYNLALIGTLGSVLGALLGFGIGHFLWLDGEGNFTALASFVLTHVPGFSESTYRQIQSLFDQYEFRILFFASLSPIPYKVFSIGSGVFDVNILFFLMATTVGQAIKFYFFAVMTILLGPGVKRFVERNLRPIALVVGTFVVGALVVFFIRTA